MSLGCNIKKYRKEKGYTQKILADMANISRTYLADVEKDRYNASLDTLKNLAEALEVPVGNLLGETSIENTIDDGLKKIVEKLKKLKKEDLKKIEKMIDVFLEVN